LAVVPEGYPQQGGLVRAQPRPGGDPQVPARELSGPLVDAAWLREHLGEPGLTVLDCRFRLGEPGAGERAWLQGHIPGAGFLDVDRDLSSEPGDHGRHPLPAPGAFQAAARRAGIGRNSRVVAYDDAGEGGAVRLWWLLRHFGHDRVAVLNGGLRAWLEQGGGLKAGPESAEEGDFVAREREGDTVSAEELHGEAAGRVLLDARAPERFRGEAEPIDPVAGRIPGAVNLPFADIAPEGRFLAPAELRARFEAAGADPDREVVAYCGSGVTACTLVLASELAGLPAARLYPGSWSEWSRRGYPAARQESDRSTDSRSSGPGGVRSR
jgi:thiosulfate/3-mercaptopyruvate sulfurtransferase